MLSKWHNASAVLRKSNHVYWGAGRFVRQGASRKTRDLRYTMKGRKALDKKGETA